MTLRLRLVLALVVLVAGGLAVFGATTYSLYSRSQYQRLDTQLQTSAPAFTGVLNNNRGGDGFPPGGGGGGREGGPGAGRGGGPDRPPLGPLGTYAELRSSAGAVLSHFQPIESTSQPKLPAKLTAADRPRFITTGSVSGSTQWRVYVGRAEGPDNNAVVVAVPLTDVRSSLQRLVLIEVAGAIALLALLSTGSWFVLRRGLRPLEEMADTAGAIAGGDLTQRVDTAGESSEVGQLGLALNTMLDEIESAFAQRDATEQRLRQFLADASHELRTPLTSIQGFAELFRLGGDPEHADLPTILRRIEEEAARMGVLVEDLLLLARLDQTRPVDREPVDLAVLAADACSDAVAAAPGRPVTLDAPDPVVVLGDLAHLRQAIGNLVTNAVRHTPDGTPIEVGAGLADGKAVVTVRDHGAGLDDDALEHAFDRFWQADRARVGAGAGLGLAIVAAAVAEHGGTATVANADGGGALFTLTLPLQ